MLLIYTDKKEKRKERKLRHPSFLPLERSCHTDLLREKKMGVTFKQRDFKIAQPVV